MKRIRTSTRLGRLHRAKGGTNSLLLIFCLLFVAITGCAPSGVREAAPIWTATPADLPDLDTDNDLVVNALQVVEQVGVTAAAEATATQLPTFTPPPTASHTPSPTNTVTPTNTATATAVPPTETPGPSPTATKPPPLPTPSGVYSWTLKVPILMYHHISWPPRGADKYRRDLSVSPRQFAVQMNYLADNGFETIDFYDLSLAITGKRVLPEKPVIITLDDGYRDNYENALPVLRENSQKATFFVITGFIDEQLDEYITWEMAEEMAAAGMRLEPHSKTHPDLSTKDRDAIIFEALGSQETLAAHIGYTPRYFCYPGGSYNDETMAVLDELGYWGAVTTVSGQWHSFDNRFEWSGMRVRNTTRLDEFINMVDPAGTISGKPQTGG